MRSARKPRKKPVSYTHLDVYKRQALQRESHIEYLLDVLLYGTAEEKKVLVAEQRKEVMKLEQRFAGHPDEHDRGGSQRKSGLDR